MLDKIIHKYLRVPYTLNIAYKRRVRKPRATVLFLHGIGRSGGGWHRVIERLDSDIQVLSVDLLGFGKSPKPAWAKYSAKMQARSIGVTLLKLLPSRPLIVVGHSLGALVAVELAGRYGRAIDQLILCSPPFYRNYQPANKVRSREKQLKALYKMLKDNPERLAEIIELGVKYKLIKEPVDVSSTNITPSINALESAIINQTSLEDAIKLKIPMQIIHGALDPLVIKRNLKYLTKNNSKASLRVILAGHEIKSETYKNAVADEIARSARTLRPY